MFVNEHGEMKISKVFSFYNKHQKEVAKRDKMKQNRLVKAEEFIISSENFTRFFSCCNEKVQRKDGVIKRNKKK